MNFPHKGQWRGAFFFFDLRLNKRLSKQPWGWWFETPAGSLWRHRNGNDCPRILLMVTHRFEKHLLITLVVPVSYTPFVRNPHIPGNNKRQFDIYYKSLTWWRHQMETFSALLAIWAGNSPVTGEFPAQRPLTRSFDVFFDLRLNKRLSKPWWGWWFEAPSRPLWRHCNVQVLITLLWYTEERGVLWQYNEIVW